MSTLDPAAPLRVVLVGAGAMGRNWVNVIEETEGVTLAGIVDLDRELAERAAAGHGTDVIVGDSLTEVAGFAGADAVIDVTVPRAHHTINAEALAAGLPVLCEKPIAPTVAEAMSSIAAAELSGRLLMTSQSRRYYPVLADLKNIVATLGRIGVVTSEFFKAPHFGGFREEMDQPLLVDMAIHAFDVARYLLEDDPIAVTCHTSNPAWSWYRGDAVATAVFEFRGGARFCYTGSWCSPGLETSWNGSWRVSGEHGSAAWDGEGPPKADVIGTGTASPRHTNAIRPGIAGALDEFADALRTGTTPAGEAHSNVHTLAMVEAAVLSARAGRTVALAEVMDKGYDGALTDELDPAVRSTLRSWGSASQKFHLNHERFQ